MGLGSGILQPSGHCISIHWSWSNLLATFGTITSLRDHTVRARNAEARHGVREKDVPFRAPLLEDATKMSFPRSLSHALDPASVLDASGETNFLPRPLQSAPPPCSTSTEPASMPPWRAPRARHFPAATESTCIRTLESWAPTLRRLSSGSRAPTSHESGGESRKERSRWIEWNFGAWECGG